MNMSGSQTEKALLKAFAGESQARNRYTFFASQARKVGLMQISAIFEETANQEKEHAERFFSYLTGGTVEICAGFPAGKVGSTLNNLLAAAEGEYDEWHNLYPAFARIAEDEDFPEVAATFRAICKSEAHHEKRYRALARLLETDSLFSRTPNTIWVCANCGYIYEGPTPPTACPACKHPQGYFKVLSENF